MYIYIYTTSSVHQCTLTPHIKDTGVGNHRDIFQITLETGIYHDISRCYGDQLVMQKRTTTLYIGARMQYRLWILVF